jgi:intraflagellar transport protein 122
MTFDGGDDGDIADEVEDPFAAQLSAIDQTAEYVPLVATREVLLALRPHEIFVVPPPAGGLPTRYYRNMIPEVPVVLCRHCAHFFHEEDYEFAVLQKGCCPFCRTPLTRQ